METVLSSDGFAAPYGGSLEWNPAVCLTSNLAIKLFVLCLHILVVIERQANAMKIAVYSRKSKFTGKGESIANQIELCRQYIKLHDQDALEEDVLIYEDEGFSGGNTDRPQFRQMMKDAREKKFSVLICYRLDRISRNIGFCQADRRAECAFHLFCFDPGTV